MPQSAYIALYVAVGTLLVHTLSLLSGNEGFRGIGRVFLGFGLIALGAYVHATARVLGLAVFVDAIGGFTAFSGLLTSVLGFRKFLRRNAVAAPAPSSTTPSTKS